MDEALTVETHLYFEIMNSLMHLDPKIHLDMWWEINKLERQGGLTEEGSTY